MNVSRKYQKVRKNKSIPHLRISHSVSSPRTISECRIIHIGNSCYKVTKQLPWPLTTTTFSVWYREIVSARGSNSRFFARSTGFSLAPRSQITRGFTLPQNPTHKIGCCCSVRWYTLENKHGTWKYPRSKKEKHLQTTNFGGSMSLLWDVYYKWTIYL